MDINILKGIRGTNKPVSLDAGKSISDDKPINALPDYEIRTMKDDLAELGLRKLEKEAKGIPIPEEEFGTTVPQPVLKKEEKLTIETKKEIFPTKAIPAPPKKTALPGTEELVAPVEEPFIPRPRPEPEELPPIPEEEKLKMPEQSYKASLPRPKRKILSMLLVVLIIGGLGFGAFFLIRSLTGGGEPNPPQQPPPVSAPKLSPSLISANETKTISILPDKSLFELIREEAKTTQEIRTFKRIGVLKNEKEFLSSIELLQNLEITISPFALNDIKGNYNLFLYSQSTGRRLGLIAEIENPENLKQQLKIWEPTMLDDFKNFYPAQVPGPRASQNFLDDIHLNVVIRYVNLPKPDLTFNYTILNNLLIIGTSKEIMYTMIEKLLGVQ